MEHLESVRKWYTKALTSIDTVNRLLNTIENYIDLKSPVSRHFQRSVYLWAFWVLWAGPPLRNVLQSLPSPCSIWGHIYQT